MERPGPSNSGMIIALAAQMTGGACTRFDQYGIVAIERWRPDLVPTHASAAVS